MVTSIEETVDPLYITPVVETGTPLDAMNAHPLRGNGGIGRFTLIYGLPNTYKTTLAFNIAAGAMERSPESSLIIKTAWSKTIDPDEVSKFSTLKFDDDLARDAHMDDIARRLTVLGLDEERPLSLDYFVEYVEAMVEAKMTKVGLTTGHQQSSLMLPTFLLVDDWDELNGDVSDDHPTLAAELWFQKKELFRRLFEACVNGNIYLILIANMSRRILFGNSPIDRSVVNPEYGLAHQKMLFFSDVALETHRGEFDEVLGVDINPVVLARCRWAVSSRTMRIRYRDDGTIDTSVTVKHSDDNKNQE